MTRGFTLIETLITVALFAVLMAAISQLYVAYGRMVSLETSIIGASLSTSALIDATRLAGRQARQIVPSHVFSGAEYSSGTTTVIFELPAVDAAGTVIAGAYDYVGVHASGTSAYRFIDAAPGSSRASGTKRLTDVLGALSFSYGAAIVASSTSLSVDATTTTQAAGQTSYMHLRGRVYLQNL